MPWSLSWTIRGSASPSWTVAVHETFAAAEADIRRIARHGDHTLFQSPEWMEEWYRTVESTRAARPVIVVLSEPSTGEPAMVLPLALRRSAFGLELGFADLGVSDYNAPLLGPAAPSDPEAMREAWALIRAALPPADLIRFDKLPARVGARHNPLAWLSGVRGTSQISMGCRIARPFAESRRAIMSEKFRAKLDEKLRRFRRLPGARFEVAQDAESAERFFDALVAQKAERARALGWDSILDRPEWVGFYRRLALRGVAGGHARVTAVTVDGAPAAEIVGFRHGDRFLDVLTAFAEGPAKKFSPGLLVMDLTMEWAADDGAEYYDLTIGAESYKEHYVAEVETLLEYVEGRSLRGLVPQLDSDARAFLRARPALAGMVRRIVSPPRAAA